ncbi:MAG: cyclodeaminase/cyclohydrolase family protein [Candidatus Izemoplasmatales bacterium]|nr:cyclodeaminase/cyclohydrolase family protein [Candidatus Izemoplasmatales bacterium]
MKLVDLKVTDFLDELASSLPAPGGGSVSALAGANGCSLILMVGSLTINKKKFKSLSETVKDSYIKTLEVFERNKKQFIDMIDLDTEAFNTLMAAYKLPKGTDEEINQRNKEIDKATLGCIKIPLKVSALALESLREIEPLIENSNKNTISDQGVSVLMLYSAAEGAAYNVLINLPGINDETLVKEFKQTIDEILLETEMIKDKLLEEVKYLLK